MLQFLIILVLIAAVIYLLIKNIEWKFKFEQRLKEAESKIKEEAIKRSSKILSGKALEKLVPILKKFNHDPHDVRWIGDPIDLVVFDGSSSGNPEKITFVEIKSGDSKLTKKQKKLKEIIEKKKIFWEEFRT